VVEPTQAPALRTTDNRGRATQPSAQSRSGRYYKRGGAPVAETADADGVASSNPNVPGERFDRTERRRAFFSYFYLIVPERTLNYPSFILIHPR
jgi:hypothetical protein